MRVTQRWSRRLAICFRKSWSCGAVIAAVLWGLVLTPTVVHGQVEVNPTIVEFTASPDHAATGLDGQPKVSRYELRIYLQGASSPLSTADLGKPTPDGDGRITATPDVLLGLPIGQVFEGRVAAVGPYGEGVSDPSNPFGLETAAAPPTSVVFRR